MTTSTVVVDGRVVTVDSGGEGTAILLLHGFPQTRAAWRSVAPELAKGFHVIVPDLPGYGGSERLGRVPRRT